MDSTPIQAPVVTPSTSSHGVVQLDWTASNDATVTNYRIYRGIGSVPTSGTPYATVSNATHSWSDPGTGLASDGTVTYSYVVQAYYCGRAGQLRDGDSDAQA